jgi:hypothetical protein
MDYWKQAVALGQQLASEHPYMFWTIVGILVVTIFGWLGDEHPKASISLTTVLFVLISVLWLYSTNDVHEMLLAAASMVVEVIIGISVQIEYTLDQRLSSTFKELEGRMRDIVAAEIEALNRSA